MFWRIHGRAPIYRWVMTDGGSGRRHKSLDRTAPKQRWEPGEECEISILFRSLNLRSRLCHGWVVSLIHPTGLVLEINGTRSENSIGKRCLRAPMENSPNLDGIFVAFSLRGLSNLQALLPAARAPPWAFIPWRSEG